MLRKLHSPNGRLAVNVALGVFTLIAAAVLLLSLFSSPVWLRSPFAGLIALGLLLFLVQAFFELSLELARAKLDPASYGRLMVSRALLSLAIGTGLIFAGFSVRGPLLGLVSGMAIPVLLWGGRIWRGVSVSLDRQLVGSFLQYGIPLGWTFALSYVIAFSDRFILTGYRGAESTGIYAAAYDLAFNGINLVSWIVGLAGTPLVMRALDNLGSDAARRQLIYNSRLLSAAIIPSAVALILFAPSVVEVLLGNRFHTGAPLVLVLSAASAVLHGIRNQHFDLAFQLSQKTRVQALAMSLAAASNIVLNFILIPSYGAAGAAWATVAAYAVALALSYTLGNRIWSVPFDLVAAAGSLFFALVAYAISGWLLNAYSLGIPPLAQLLLNLSLGSLVYLGLWLVTLRSSAYKWLGLR